MKISSIEMTVNAKIKRMNSRRKGFKANAQFILRSEFFRK